jgi:hypothetical protein
MPERTCLGDIDSTVLTIIVILPGHLNRYSDTGQGEETPQRPDWL